MRGLGVVLAGVLAVTACGDSTSRRGGSPGDASPGAPDAPDAPGAATFTSFVIDLIQNQTANDTQPVPLAAFESLGDPDTANDGAYVTLFP